VRLMLVGFEATLVVYRACMIPPRSEITGGPTNQLIYSTLNSVSCRQPTPADPPTPSPTGSGVRLRRAAAWRATGRCAWRSVRSASGPANTGRAAVHDVNTNKRGCDRAAGVDGHGVTALPMPPWHSWARGLPGALSSTRVRNVDRSAAVAAFAWEAVQRSARPRSLHRPLTRRPDCQNGSRYRQPQDRTRLQPHYEARPQLVIRQ
jgi:hypothetical protein